MNERWKTILVIIIPAIAAIFAILGVSVFKNVAIADELRKILRGGELDSSVTSTAQPVIVVEGPTSEPGLPSVVNPTSDSNISNVIPGAADPTEQPVNTFKIEPTTLPDNSDSKKNVENEVKIELIDINPSQENGTTNHEQNNGVENSESGNGTAVSDAEESVSVNGEDSQTSDQIVHQKLEIPSTGYLRLSSKNSRKQAKKENCLIDITKVTDENGDDVENPESSSFEYSAIVNEDTSDQGDETIYIPVYIGTYYFVFTNCDIENLEVYFVENTDQDNGNATQETNDTAQSSSQSDGAELTVPSQGIWQICVPQNQTELSYSFHAEKSFTPIIKFYSDTENGEEINITIIDSAQNALQTVDLNQKDENGNYELTGGFSFIEGEEYIMKISSNVRSIDTKCYLEFLEMDDNETE